MSKVLTSLTWATVAGFGVIWISTGGPANAQTLIETMGAQALRPTVQNPNGIRAAGVARDTAINAAGAQRSRDIPVSAPVASTAPVSPPPTQPSLTERPAGPRWRLRGMADGEERKIAVIQTDERTMYLEPGDRIVDGVTVVAVRPGEIVVRENGRTAVYQPW